MGYGILLFLFYSAYCDICRLLLNVGIADIAWIKNKK